MFNPPVIRSRVQHDGQGQSGLARWLFALCYAIGFAIIWLPHKVWLWLRGALPKTRPTKTRRSASSFNDLGFRPSKIKPTRGLAAWSVSGAVLALVVFLTVSLGASFIQTSLAVQSSVTTDAKSAVADVAAAISSWQDADQVQAQSHLVQAWQNLVKARKEIDESSVLLRGIVQVVPAGQSQVNALRAAEQIARISVTLSEMVQAMHQAKISSSGLELADYDQWTGQLMQMTNELSQTWQSLQTSLAAVDSEDLPAKYQLPFVRVQTLAISGERFVQTIQSGVKLLRMLRGQKQILILLQNSNELRPTGGFIGTVGAIKIKSGHLESVDVRSVYDYDGQLEADIAPPLQMFSVNPKWHLRDSNWYPDFPTTASIASRFYERAGGETPDFVIALTPEVFVRLLNLTGPISVPGYDVTVSATNFNEVVERATSIDYDKSTNQPKALLRDLFPLLLTQIGRNSGNLPRMVLELENLARQGEIQISSRDPDAQSLLTAQGWSGQMPAPESGDSLAIVAANLGGTKTDQSLKRAYDLTSVVSPDGTVTNTLKLTITNPLPTQPGLENRSFYRIYVPKGSRMIATSGFALPNLPLPTAYDDVKREPEVLAAESAARQDPATGLWIGEENNLTVFGHWLTVGGGESKTAEISYQLPVKLTNLSQWPLRWRRQPGTMQTTFSYHFRPGIYAVAAKTQGLDRIDQTYEASGNLDRSQFFGLVLTK